ncbi:hypothetical protein QWJ90_00580 [Microbacterium oryzae]|uniref:hypothetical protein n=1 Tax=Microbacterium oryzae TaxID=743009 RepID=UPI0025AF8ACE|nr:hypothetical protein [Microbacterium oryzae]MDN3309424.1 hypothetical protein [Microbacterium oryzae]
MSSSLARHDEGYAEAALIRHGQPIPSDERVPEGVHWRIIPPPGILPAGPVVVCDSPIDGTGSREVRSDRDTAGPWHVDEDHDLLLTVDSAPDQMTGWLGIQAEGRLRIAVIAERTASNGEYIEITARDMPPDQGECVVAASDISRVRVTGRGTVIEVWASSVPRERDWAGEVLDVAALDPDAADAMGGAYAPLNVALEPARERVLRAAPDRPVPYAPRQPWPEYTVDDEVARVSRLVDEEDTIRGWLRLAGEGILAGRRGEVVQEVGGAQALRYPVASALGVAAADPGVARWLARQGMFVDSPRGWNRGPAMAVALVPMIVLRAPVFVRPAPGLEEIYESQVPGALGELRARAADIPRPPEYRPGRFGRDDPFDPFGGGGGNRLLRPRWVVDLVQLPMPLTLDGSPALPPAPSPALSGPATWTLAEPVDATPQRTDAREQRVALRGVAPFGPVSFVQIPPDPGGPDRVTMHDRVSDDVARPLLAGWPQPTTLGAPPVTDPVLRGRVPVATPADARTVEWEVQLGDWIGRWGEPGRVVAEPPLPAPPVPPVLRATFVRLPATGTAPASPGTIHVELVVSPATAPGALPLGAVHLRIDGADIPLATPDVTTAHATVTHDHPAPPTVPGQDRVVRIEAWVTDAAGTSSAAPNPAVDVHAADARALPVPSVSPRLVMTGRAGPAPDVAVRLSVRAAPGAAFYRFYTAPEQVVRAAVGLASSGFRSDSRPARAAALLAAAARPPRKGFTLAATAEVVGGVATGALAIPSVTTDLVLVRAVPVTGVVDAYGKKAEGVEADVAAAVPTYLAVPTADVPPLPRLTAEVIADGAAREVAVTVTTSGVPSSVLRRLPGVIEARLVEAIDRTDPHYWPQVTTVPLTAHPDGSHTATARIPVPTWARVRLAASVRFAAEGTTVPGADIVVDPDLASAAPQPDAVISPWGPLSAPISVDVDGPEPAVTSAPDASGTAVTVTGLPLTAAGSSPFTAVLYLADPSGALMESSRHRSVTGEAASFTVAPAGAAAVVLVDPFGRPRAAVRID